MPLSHPPEHAQLDFGEAIGVICGVLQNIHFFCMDLPQSHAPFVKAYWGRLARVDAGPSEPNANIDTGEYNPPCANV